MRPIPRPRLGRPRLLIAGCGDIGLRIVARLRDRFRVFGTVTSAAGADALRRAGAVPMVMDLDEARARTRVGALAQRALALYPPTPHGRADDRTRRLLHAFARARRRAAARLVYVSTTGVYGDRRGEWADETSAPAPGSERARRRLDAERRMRARPWCAAVLRVPGIYAAGRLPLERLRRALPVALPERDVVTNHIHADDLARACIAALFRAAPRRVYNIADDTQLLLGEYLDRLADRAGLPRPPRASWEALRVTLDTQRLSFMSESRRVRNTRMKRELRLRLRHPDIDAGLARALPLPGAAPPPGGGA